MPEMPDYRTEPSPSPEGDAIAVSRWTTWAENLDPTLAEDDRDAIAARVIRESELIAFWMAWHRAGGFAELERGGWDRSTIFRKIRRFRSYYGVHPDHARFPWLDPDWERCWRSDEQVALNWASQPARKVSSSRTDDERWQPHWAPVRPDPHDLEAYDHLAEAAARRSQVTPIGEASGSRRRRPRSRSRK
ncbi:MAG TPA: hypothetical protein VFA11_13960 [Acidimicrobiales bacterium]|nr:hypothetical protein [Acidimicrobiales bacterium]